MTASDHIQEALRSNERLQEMTPVSEVAQLRHALQIARGALVDIALATDLTMYQIRLKSQRIYEATYVP